MPQTVEVDGQVHEFPDEATTEQITTALNSHQAKSSAPISTPSKAPPLSPERTADVQKFLKDTPYPGDDKSLWELANTTPDAIKIPDVSNETAGALAENTDVSGVYHILKAAIGDEHAKSVAGSALTGATHLVNSLMTPAGLATLGLAGASKPLSKGLAVAFGLHQFSQNLDQLKAIGDAATFDEKAHLISDLIVGDTAGAMAFMHGFGRPEGGGVVMTPKPQPERGLHPPLPTSDVISEPTTSTTVTTDGSLETPQREAQRMLANINQRLEQPIIGEPNALKEPSTTQSDGNGAAQPQESTGETPANLGGEGVRPSGQGEEVRSETMKLGGGESGGVPLDVLKTAAEKIAGATKTGTTNYAKGWVARVKEWGKIVSGFNRMRNLSELRDIIPALYDSADTQAGYLAGQAQKHVALQVKTKIAREAATFVRQSNGDKEGMLAKLDAIRGKGYDPVIDYAQKHWDELQKASDAAGESTDAAHEAAVASGLDLTYREGYAKGAYEEYDPHNRNVVFDAQKGGGGRSTSFTKPKVFNDYTEAIAAGYEPKTLDLADLTQSAVLNTMRKVNQRLWIESLGNMKLPGGEPLIESPNRITAPDSTGKIKSHGLQAPEGYKLVQVSPGNSVAVQADMAPLIEKLTDTSHFPQIAAKIAGGLKHNILAFDVYHGSRFAQMQAAFMRRIGYNKGLALLEYSDTDLAKALANDDITPEQAKWARENRPVLESGIKAGLNVGRISDALFKDIAPMWPGAKATSHFIFDKLSRGIIAESYVYAAERNAKLYPNKTPAETARISAKEVNTWYRNLGNQGLLKSKTWQDSARALAFAPQWFEGRVRSEAKGYTDIIKSPVTGKLGNVGKGMAQGLVTLFALNQVINMMTRGTPTWDNPEQGHKLDAYIPDLAEGGTGYYLSPDSIFAETFHDARKALGRGSDPLDIPQDLLASQIHPTVRAAWDVLTGHNFSGQKLPGFDRFLEAGKDAAPAPLVLHGQDQKGSVQRRIMNFLGVKVDLAGSYSSQAYQLAGAWMRANDIPKREPEPSAYGKLTAALRDGNTKRAKTEYDALAKRITPETIDKYYDKFPNVNFTGKKDREDQFFNALNDEQKAIYRKALDERENVSRAYQELK